MSQSSENEVLDSTKAVCCLVPLVEAWEARKDLQGEVQVAYAIEYAYLYHASLSV